jgi:thioredoxin reductase (NADPH)
MYDIIIIGSGPAGLTAGLYASRGKLNTLLIAGFTWGGQLMLTTEVENYPGFKEGILGPDLISQMWKQAERFGCEFIFEDTTGIDFSNPPFRVSVGARARYEGAAFQFVQRAMLHSLPKKALLLLVEETPHLRKH